MDNICENCLEDISWCECKARCVKGNHFWRDDSEVCNFCKITKQEVLEGVKVF